MWRVPIQVFEMSDYSDVHAVGRELSEIYINVATSVTGEEEECARFSSSDPV